jgi:Ni,Fe-hydrogenase III small subunit
MAIALRRTFDAAPEPKLVIAAGECACGRGIFGESYATVGAVEKLLPVDVAIPGCPPSPTALLQGILAAITRAAPPIPKVEPTLGDEQPTADIEARPMHDIEARPSTAGVADRKPPVD